ncbi:hypothetical protein VTG60DRAFT_4457 [Thermothelomyces hinnuleus]
MESLVTFHVLSSSSPSSWISIPKRAAIGAALGQGYVIRTRDGPLALTLALTSGGFISFEIAQRERLRDHSGSFDFGKRPAKAGQPPVVVWHRHTITAKRAPTSEDTRTPLTIPSIFDDY